MAVYLIGTAGPANGRRWPLQPGQWTIGSDPGCTVALGPAPGIAPCHARLDINAQRILVCPEPPHTLVLNGQAISAPAPLRPGDQLGLGPVVLGLETTGAKSTAPAAAPAVPAAPAAPAAGHPAAPAAPAGAAAHEGVALPPPPPPKWPWFVGGIVLLVAIVAVAVVIRLVPQRQTDPLRHLPLELRNRVRTSTVWIKASLAQGRSEGSGFVYRNGYVLTNAHVVDHSQAVQVVFDSGTDQVREVDARIVKQGHPGEVDDIALLSVATGRVPALPLVEIKTLDEGQTVAAFGFPLGSSVSTSQQGPQISIRSGTITALRKGDDGAVQWVESDLLAEVGNSGGPVVSLDGKVVGLATMLVGPNLRTARIVPATLLRSFAAQAVQ